VNRLTLLLCEDVITILIHVALAIINQYWLYWLSLTIKDICKCTWIMRNKNVHRHAKF
jgi:hypothetical protein